MTRTAIFQMQTGRLFWTTLQNGQEITRAIADLAERLGLAVAAFSLSGQVSTATVGTYDADQQVWVTQTETGGADIVACRGDVVRAEGRPLVSGRIVLADKTGRVYGGRLFADTVARAVEIQLVELVGKGPTRVLDPVSALWCLSDPLERDPIPTKEAT